MAEADLRHVHARGRPTDQIMKKKKGSSSGGPPEKVGGVRALHGTQCASARGSVLSNRGAPVRTSTVRMLG